MYMNAESQKELLQDQNEMEGPLFKIEDDPRILPGVGRIMRTWTKQW